MAGKSDFLENRFLDGFFRGGCLTTAGAAGASTVVKGIWTASTAYVLGDIVVPHASMTGAGGKLLKCTTAGTSGVTNTLAIGNPGTTVTDNAIAIWTVIATVPALDQLYVGLLTAAPSDSGGGTEVSGGSYARVAVASTLANWAGTQGAGTTVASTGTAALTSNNNAITFPLSTGSWGTATHFGIYDQATGGNLLYWAALTASQVIPSGATTSFAAGQLTVTED